MNHQTRPNRIPATPTKTNIARQPKVAVIQNNMLAGGVKQFSQVLANDPLLRTMDQMWNANPFHEIVPVDWAKLARALRTVWLQSLGMPESLSSALTLN